MLVVPAAAQESELRSDIGDHDIEIAIQNEMFIDEGVASHRIDIEVQQGIVTLSGGVDNVLARQRAREIAMATKGVRSVVNTIEVTPKGRPAKELRQDIERALMIDPTTESYEVDVSVNDDGIVTLSGSVDSWAEQELCLDVARGVRGVRQVKDDIRIAAVSDRSDPEIRNDVIGRLRNDARLDHGLIDVTVNDAQVSLSGSVGSAAERQRALSDAWVAGAKGVDVSALDVRWWLRDDMKRSTEHGVRDDQEIEEAVEMAFIHDPRVYSFSPQVEVDKGVVTLSGTVSNLQAKKAASETARNTYGVWRVRNFLLVRSDAPVSDGDIKNDILKAIRRNPYTSQYDVAVSVLNGAVTIRGTVDSGFEKEEMLDVVTSVKGVLAVHEFIDVGTSWSFETDWNIKEDIEGELWWSPYVDSDEVHVAVEDGVATLTGKVDDWSEWVAALDNAYDGGARKVRNELEVANWPPYAVN
jgi:osmotically-inducible protein OsmY